MSSVSPNDDTSTHDPTSVSDESTAGSTRQEVPQSTSAQAPAAEARSAQALEYNKRQLRWAIINEIAVMVFMIAWVVVASVEPFREFITSYQPWPALGILMALIVLTYQVLDWPLEYFSSYKLEHAFDLSTESLGKWIGQRTKGMLLGVVIFAIVIALLYVCLWYLPLWWLWVYLAWMALSVLFAQVFPVLILPLFHKSEPLGSDSELPGRLAKLAEGTGIEIEGVYRLTLSDTTKKANAMLAGLGSTRRVLLGDTLLDNYTTEEIEIVMAHELAHHVHGHIWKGLVQHALVSTVMFAIVYLILDSYAQAGDASGAVLALPAVLLAISVYGFVVRPLFNAISRHHERQADTYALDNVAAAPGHFISAFTKLADQNLADPDPPRWVEIMFEDHPPIHKRLAMARERLDQNTTAVAE